MDQYRIKCFISRLDTIILTYGCTSFKNKNSSASINGVCHTDRRTAQYVETTDTRITNALTEIQFMTAEKQQRESELH
jgi:hypothetical protein